MKLNNTFPELDILIKKMGATEIRWKSSGRLTNLQLQKLSSIEGLERTLEDIEMDEHGLMYIDGQPVILFIKDTWNTADMLNHDPKGPNRIRFHVVGDCTTMEQMKRRKRYDRYTFTANQGGKFLLFARKEKYSNLKVKVTAELAVCMNCLIRLKYKGSGHDGIGKPNNETRAAKEKFNIKNFFNNFVQTLISKPKFSEISYPEPEYTAEFEMIKKKLKEAWKYKCSNSECKVDLSLLAYRAMLHCHHIDGNPGNNNEHNLEVLCICCHAEKGWHLIKPEKNKELYERCLKIKKSQGIV
jgi:hypothetical protein